MPGLRWNAFKDWLRENCRSFMPTASNKHLPRAMPWAGLFRTVGAAEFEYLKALSSRSKKMLPRFGNLAWGRGTAGAVADHPPRPQECGGSVGMGVSWASRPAEGRYEAGIGLSEEGDQAGGCMRSGDIPCFAIRPGLPATGMSRLLIFLMGRRCRFSR